MTPARKTGKGYEGRRMPLSSNNVNRKACAGKRRWQKIDKGTLKQETKKIPAQGDKEEKKTCFSLNEGGNTLGKNVTSEKPRK